MKRTFFIPFLSALIGGAVVVALVAAFGGLSSNQTTVTDVQAAPRDPDQRVAEDPRPDPARSLCPRRARAWRSSPRRSCRSLNRRSTCSAANPQRQGKATGSGIVIDSNGTILTNYHVVENAVKVTVSFEKGKAVEAQVVGKDPSNDLAILRDLNRRADAAPAHAR